MGDDTDFLGRTAVDDRTCCVCGGTNLIRYAYAIGMAFFCRKCGWTGCDCGKKFTRAHVKKCEAAAAARVEFLMEADKSYAVAT